jgi:uncharacterized protein YllA (UPF0747 family)
VSATAVRLPIDIRRFPWIRRIAVDYAHDFSRLSGFFAGNPAESEAWRDAIARAQRHPRHRDAIASILERQQRRRQAPPEALSASNRLRDPQSVAIVTGQQGALFGGPLYTLLKAITALRLADRVRTEFGVPAVAVFWIEGEDHDWDEVKTCTVLDSDLSPRRVMLANPSGANETSVARVHLDDSIDAALQELGAVLQTTEYTPGVIEGLRRAYRTGAGMVDAFGTWLESVLGPQGLVVYDCADAAAKPLVANLFAREVEHIGRTTNLALEAGAALEAQGYHAQATPTRAASRCSI